MVDAFASAADFAAMPLYTPPPTARPIPIMVSVAGSQMGLPSDGCYGSGMSTDYDGVCDVHRIRWHVGQDFSSGPCFGYGRDDTEGRRLVAELDRKSVV